MGKPSADLFTTVPVCVVLGRQVSWTRPSVSESSVAAGGDARGAYYPPLVWAVPVLQVLPRRRVPSLLSAAVGVSLSIDRWLTDSEGI